MWELEVCIGCGVRIQRPEQLLSEARLPAIGSYRSRLDDNYWTAKVSDKCRSQATLPKNRRSDNSC